MSITSSDLPLELIQEILVISAESSLKQAATLATVSQHIYILVKPILLRTIVYWDGEETWPCYLDAEWLQSNGKYPRNLLWSLKGESIDPVLKYCTNLTNIAIWLDFTAYNVEALVESLSQHRPKQISTDFVELFGGRFLEHHAKLPMFSNVTHFEFSSSCSMWDLIEGIQYLPRLTHLSLPTDGGPNLPSILRNALQYCKNLVVLVIFSAFVKRRAAGSGEEAASEVQLRPDIEKIGDPRIVSFDCAYLEEWEVGTQGGRDMWTCADEIVDARLRRL